MQLDFSFRENASAQVLTVSALTSMIRKTMESRFGEIWVEGEVSNLRRQASGHSYFTLKDAGSQIACVLFAQQARYMSDFQIQDGIVVQLLGQLTVYEPRGQYQLITRLIQLKGIGALQARFEAIKRKLAAEGLFRLERKRILPRFPRRIGVITSPTGAAIRDFLHVLARRHPGIEVILYPVRVQGKAATSEIAHAVRQFAAFEQNSIGAVDTIVITRGGGSIEDLWAFNEEEVARALFDSPIPTVSAVGHEIDFTIADFVADVRAATPSAAAEILAVDQEELLSSLRQQASRLFRTVASTLRLHRERLNFVQRSALVREPMRILQENRQTLDRLQAVGASVLQNRMKEFRAHVKHALAIFQSQHPASVVHHIRQNLNYQSARLATKMPLTLQQYRHRLQHLHALVEAFSPQATLLRGFTITTCTDGAILHSAEEASQCSEMRIRFADGQISVQPQMGETQQELSESNS